jgi:hypothetical protein
MAKAKCKSNEDNTEQGLPVYVQRFAKSINFIKLSYKKHRLSFPNSGMPFSIYIFKLFQIQ